jgi:Patatin-like phospholipase
MKVWFYGVAQAFQERVDIHSFDYIAGASAGALTAAALLVGGDFNRVVEYTYEVAEEARSSPLGPFRLRRYIEGALEEGLPEDCVERLNGKLVVSVTELGSWKNHLVSEFESRDEVKFYLHASSLIPLLGGLPIRNRRGVFFDGGATQMLPNATLTVSVFGPANLTPSKRIPIRWALYPPTVRELKQIFALGRRDGHRFIDRCTTPRFVAERNLMRSASMPVFSARLHDELERIVVEPSSKKQAKLIASGALEQSPPQAQRFVFLYQGVLACFDVLLLVVSAVWLAPLIWLSSMLTNAVALWRHLASTIVLTVAHYVTLARSATIDARRKRHWQLTKAKSTALLSARTMLGLVPVLGYVASRRSEQYLEESSSLYRYIRSSMFPI